MIGNALRLVFCIGCGMCLGAEWFAYIAGYGINITSVIVIALGMIAVLIATVWDYCNLVEDVDKKDKLISYLQRQSSRR